MVASSIKLRNRVHRPKELLGEIYGEHVAVEISDCDVCKHAICSSDGIYCGKLREHTNGVVSCPHFDTEPLEYKLYRRS